MIYHKERKSFLFVDIGQANYLLSIEAQFFILVTAKFKWLHLSGYDF